MGFIAITLEKTMQYKCYYSYFISSFIYQVVINIKEKTAEKAKKKFLWNLANNYKTWNNYINDGKY